MIEVVGTSHVAGAELEHIRDRVREARPDVVALELDPARLEALLRDRDGRRPRNPFLLLLKSVQDLLGRHTGVAPGSDMLAAYTAATGAGIDIVLVDREMAVTLRRLRAVPLREKVKFAGFLLLSPLLFPGVDIDLDTVPEQAVIDQLLTRFRVGFPQMYRVLVEERNAVMAERLSALEAEYGHVMAFLGAGHVRGVRARLDGA